MTFLDKLKKALRDSHDAGEDYNKMVVLKVTLSTSGKEHSGTVCEIGKDYFILKNTVPGGGVVKPHVRHDQVASFTRSRD